MAIEFRTLNKDEIEVRVGNVINTAYKKGANLLLYKNARVDMDMLDSTVGSEKWQRKHYAVKDNMYCSVGILCDNNWVWKDDCGTESNTEKEKGEASDAFKRACVNWGIGRELYTSPIIFIEWEVEQIERNGKKVNVLKYNPSFNVESITYDERRRINSLRITATSGNKTSVVFEWKDGKPTSMPIPTATGTATTPLAKQEYISQQTKPTTNGTMTLEQAKAFYFSGGKHANEPFGTLKDDYLTWVSQNGNGKAKMAADIILKSRNEVKSYQQSLIEDTEDDCPF